MLKVLNGPNIAAGNNLSDGLDCSEGAIVRITMPPAWVGDKITFQTSSDGVFYNDIFMPDGTELKFSVIAGTAILGMRLTTGFVKFARARARRPWCSPTRARSRSRSTCCRTRRRRRAASFACGYSWEADMRVVISSGHGKNIRGATATRVGAWTRWTRPARWSRAWPIGLR